jgi:acyl carrier protein
MGTAPVPMQDPMKGRQAAMTTEQEVLAGLAASITRFAGPPASQVTPEADLIEDLNIDSLAWVEIIVSVQEKFGIEIPDADLRGLRTVQDVVRYVQRAQRARISA